MGKLKINVDDLLPRLSQVVGVVNSKNAMPILGDVLFVTRKEATENSGFSLTASDSETWLTVFSPCVEFDEDMMFCIAATDIYKALSNLKGKEVEIELDPSTHVAKCTYGNGRFALPYEDAGDFPRPNMSADDMIIKELHADNLQRSIEKAGFAVASDELRPVMNGVHFDFTHDGMVAVATDGQKLAKYTDTTIRLSDDEPVSGFTLPKKPAHIMLGLLNGYNGDITLKFNDKCVRYTNNDFTLTTRLIEGNYPQYNRVIPTDNPIDATVNKAEMITALKRVMPMGSMDSELVRLTFAMGMLTISAEDLNFSKSASEEIGCEYSSPELAIGFNGSILMSILQNIDGEQVKISLKEPSRAGLFEPATPSETFCYVSLLMPIFIK